MDNSNSETHAPNALREILSDLGHLDLTGKIIPDDRGQRAVGGYCDIFSGTLTANGTKIAIRRIRVFLEDDLSFARVHSTTRH